MRLWYEGTWLPLSQEWIEVYGAVGDNEHRAISAEASGAVGAYMSYIDPLLVGCQQTYYGKHYDRLVEIKKTEDPNGCFDFQQGFGSEFNPSPPKSGGSLDLNPLNRTFP